MTYHRNSVAGVALAALAASAMTAGAAFADPLRVHLDEETVVGGIAVACTGIGQTKSDPKWLAYPVRVEFADAQRAYLAGEEVRLFNAGSDEALLDVTCEGPWVLLKLPVGKSFRVWAQLTQAGPPPRTATVKSPAHGQSRFVLTFPDAH